MIRFRRAALLGGLAAGGIAVVAFRRRARSAGPVHHTRRASRNVRVAGIGARAGTSYAVHQARRTFASAPRRAELDAAHQLQTAEQVAQALGDMKGALMKVGQMLSYLDEGLPEPFREALAQLQQDAPPMSAELAAGVIERELGARPEKLFAEWDPIPLAAASIGQVHPAITNDGRAVAVKVQYPGVDEAIRADLDNAGLLFAGMKMLFPGMDTGPVVEEIRVRLREELDYRKEADNQRFFVEAYRDHPFIHVPAVVDEYCTTRVFTSELAEGERFAAVEGWTQRERDLAAETIFRFVIGSLYRLHAFNGDPHPGNYLFRPGGRVTFLDFGLVKRFTAQEVHVLRRLNETLVEDPDPAAFRATLEQAGFLRAGAPVTDDELVAFFQPFYHFVVDDTGALDDKYASDTARRLLQLEGGNDAIRKAGNVPPAYVILQRINLGLYAVLGRLRARAPWRGISQELWPWTEGSPATDLGREEAVWRARSPAFSSD